jgi:pimeloyl-ACP methyl ester carboxylesterase
MDAPSAQLAWWEFAVRGALLRGTIQRPLGERSSDRVAVVAVHGGPGIDGGGLRHVLAPLARQTELVVPDLRGHGRSDRATPASWTLDDWADDLAGVIDALDLHRPVVVGVSFGGWVALRHAARHPDQLGGLVIAATTARLPGVEEGAERMGALGGPASAALWRTVHSDPSVEATAAFGEHVLSLMALRTPDAALAAVRAAQIRTPQVNRHFTPMFSQLDLTDDARRVRCPATVIVGEQDPLTTPALATATFDAFPGPARLRILPDTAHDLLIDAPDSLLAEIELAVTLLATRRVSRRRTPPAARRRP